MQDFLPNSSGSSGSSGVIITRFNYNRPKWFGGFFGKPTSHNKTGNCVYDAQAMTKIISAQDLNKLVQPLYTMTPVLAYHLSITIFISLSILLTLMQQGFNYLIQFGFVTSLDPGNGYLRTLGIIWYVVWGLGLVTTIPLYYVTVHNVERYFRDCSDKVFNEMRVRFRIKKDQPNKFLLIEGFKKLDSLEIMSL